MKANPTKEQLNVLSSDKKNLIVSASAGSGKTFVVVQYLTNLIIEKRVPVKRLLVLTFTRAAAGEMRERLNKALIGQKANEFLLEQIDDLSISDICTIDAFCEKLVSRNLDRLDIDEGFKVMEDTSQIRWSAFENALEQFEQAEPDALQEIYYSFRKNKKAIFEIVLDLASYFCAIKDCETKIDYYISNQPYLFEKALKLLNDDFISLLAKIKSDIGLVATAVSAEPKYIDYCNRLANLFSFTPSDNFINNVHTFNLIDLPNIPIIRGESRDHMLADEVKALRVKLKKILEDYTKYQFDEDDLIKQKSGSLAIALLKLYKMFNVCYASLKRKLDVLDFVDIENLAFSIMQDENILLGLQEKYDYIFVDEYQDTNRIQEAIIKPITRKGHFIAVGDPKQGIYGFRNATMEIMQQDIAEFEEQADGEVAYLRGNFRSDNRLLSFINRIFEKVMTTESVGIDYIATSLLRGEMPFDKMALPSVRVDIIDGEELTSEKVEKGIYSIKEDSLYLAEKNGLEVNTIVARIDDLLMQKIYDEKNKTFRQVEFNDIAILLRNRGSLMSDLALALSRRGYPVISDEKKLAVEEPEVQMLINLCKLLLNSEDDVALISVMSSFIGGFSLDELAALRLKYPDEKYFYNIVKSESENPHIKEFFDMINDLALQVEVNGLYYALNELFGSRDYFAYLKYNDVATLTQVNNFLQDIKVNDFDFNVAEAISYFTEVGGKKRNTNVSGGNAIKLMTIHASKGLEYPIVILAGAGQKLEKPNTKNYMLNSEFGLGTYIFNEVENIKYTSPILEIIKKQNHRKDMIDEIMIFYVALTRAKNHLYIVGQENINNLLLSEGFNVLDAKNYLALIGFAFGKEFIKDLIAKETICAGDWQFNHVTKVQNLSYSDEENRVLTCQDEETEQALNEYFNFVYPKQRLCKVNLKNTVTGLNTQENEFYEKLDLEEVEHQNYIDQGNAYHEALKFINFENVTDFESLDYELSLHAHELSEGYLELLDKNILLKNILLIKNTIKNNQIYKEKQFVMSVGIREVFGEDSDDEVLVQGIVDLFAIGENNILIDYKFTQQKNPQKILNKYSKQLNLYTLAIEKGFNIKINKRYILSLKNAQLIEYFG